jgi:hypothetical protein
MAELTTETTELLAQAIVAIQYGHKSTAAMYLNRILEQDPENMDAWRWLAECMPSPAKREYCLERAGLNSGSQIPAPSLNRKSLSAIKQEMQIDPVLISGPNTIAEKHAGKVAIRGQGRAELPPLYQVPSMDEPVDRYHDLSEKRSKPEIQKPQPNSSNPARKPKKPRKNRITGRVLLFSIGVISLSVLSGYILFSTGLTTYNRVLDWVNVQIENNKDSLPVIGVKTTPTPMSLFDQPAEETNVLATYFPTQVITPIPDEPQPGINSNPAENDARVAAEIPTEAVPEVVSTPEEVVPTEDNIQNVSSEEVLAAPSGFVDGPKVIGTSIKGNNIEIMQFGNGPVERMMVAGIHGGNEWNTTALADQLITYIRNNPQVIPADRTLYILRLLNPDGEARGHDLDGRTNERGVDLNRNWDAFWVADWPRDGCWNYRPISSGSEPFSEPETRAMRDFLNAHHIGALISYHSAALGVFAGGRPPEAESIRLAKSISGVTSYAYPPLDTGCKYTGQFADWLSMHGTAAVDLELANHTDTDFDENLKVLDVLMKWEPSTGPKSLTGLINLAKYAAEKPTFMDQVTKYGNRTLNEINGLIFGRQEEK